MSRLTATRQGAAVELVFDDGGMNLLSPSALEELERSIAAIGGDATLVVFRSGRERLFAAGADMKSMAEFDGLDAARFATLGQRVFESIERLDALTAVLIDGDCYGGALDLALAFDVRLATRRSRFAHPGARLGIVTGFGGTVRLPRLSHRLASRLLLANETIDATTAHELGLVDDLFESADAMRRRALDELAARAAAPELRVAKTLLRTSPRLTLPQLTLLARRTEQLSRGTMDNGRS